MTAGGGTPFSPREREWLLPAEFYFCVRERRVKERGLAADGTTFLLGESDFCRRNSISTKG